ncbi:heteromeric transposase endonuclease subunit TnsA [Cellvibrio sp. NN19]|uniref:heteromeric transposase endonuclease subunit TnsA n=1 Tax=Cellvibrio chitinivorans TaxID=3102792 RepID=UPI002B403083|nr:heteromeric transposase endonuclease subunit TnsA [Cellvibrio sp. NN19]
MPVRKITKNYRNVTGIAAHRKADGQAMFESTLERDFITLLEFSPSVQKFEVQPLRLDWQDDQAKDRTYTPDVLVSYELAGKTHQILYEVKYRSELREKWPELHPKFRAAVKFARIQGWKFKIITETEVRTPLLQNAKFLLPFLKQGANEEEHMDLLDLRLKELKESTPTKLIQSIFHDEWNQASLLPSLWYMIGSFQIGVDMNTKLTMDSPIWRLQQ